MRRVAHRAANLVRKTALVGEPVVAGIAAPEHANVTGDPGGNDRHTRGCGFADDIGAAFHARTHHKNVAAREQAERCPMRYVAQPAVARIGAHQPLRRARHARGKRFAKMHDLDLGEVAEMGEGQRGAKRVFLIPKMSHYRNSEAVRRRPARGANLRGLVDHPGLASQSLRKLQLAHVLKDDETVGKLK